MPKIFLDGLYVLSQNWKIILSITAIFSVNFLFSPKAKQEVSLKILLPFFLFSLLLRLAFLRDIYAPSYFDSIEHLRIIKGIVEGWENHAFLDSLQHIVPTYYHLGFHFLASLLTFGSRADPVNVMLVFGQVTLAILPIPVAILIWHETKNKYALIFTALLAGFGWYMPGFAINWGKYPALLGILAFEITLSLAYTFSQKKHIQFAILTLGILISTLIHTRTLIIFLITLTSWLFAKKIKNLPKNYRHSILKIQLLGILIFGILIQTEPLLKLALEPYLENHLLITIILILSFFALAKFPRAFYFSLFFILFTLASLSIPVESVFPQLANQTLLDRPFVEMILYFPLSLLGGLGLAGLLKYAGIFANEKKSRKILLYIKSFLVILFIAAIGIISLKNYDFYPSDCCVLLNYDDTIAFDWMRENLPANVRILTAGRNLQVIPNATETNLVGTDAGVWIPQRLNREIILMPYQLDFLSLETSKLLCQSQVDYIYVGSTNQHFNGRQLEEKRTWYQKILFLPKVQIYQFKGCN